MDLYSCPVCGGRLAWGEHACRCPEGHSFDIAAQGYVNLLLANQKSSPNPGDNAEMVRRGAPGSSTAAATPRSPTR